MFKFFKGALDWIGRFTALQTIIQFEFVRTLLFSTVYAVLTGAAGYFAHVSLMWVLVGIAAAFTITMQGLLRSTEYRALRTPLNKLRYVGTAVQYDLVPIHKLNRHERKASQKLQIPPVPAPRELAKVQLGVELRNEATFPISFIFELAETEMERETPPRGRYPKPPILLLPGNTIRLMDDAIDMDGMLCERLEGKMRIIVKYGLPKKEIYELNFNAKKVDVLMQPAGFYTGIYTEWEE